jgi:membrane-bound serine protease (ClpP class)
MRRVSSLLIVLLPLILAPTVARAQPSPSSSPRPTPIVVLKVEGAIDHSLMAYLDTQLTSAEQRGAVVVLQLNTSGSLNEDGVALADRVAAMRVPVIAWVGPVPAKASGAGLLLMYASSLAAVSPGSQTGPLYPVDLATPDQGLPGLTATIQGWLDARGKATQLERLDTPLPAQTALDLKIADVTATSVPELLDLIDGMTVPTPNGPVALTTRVATDAQQAAEHTVDITFDNMGPVKRILHGVSSPSMVYFLLVIGLACIAFEITQPGFGFAGFAGIGMLGLAAGGVWAVPPSSWVAFLAVIGGVGLMTTDVRLRELGPLTALGLAAFAAGSVFAWHGVAPAIRISPWLIGGTVIASALFYGFALTVAIQSRDRIANTQRGLIGLVGVARGKLAPDGPMYVKGAMWRGRSTGQEPIDSGTKVRVRGLDGLVLKVEAEPDPESQADTSGGQAPQPAAG